MYRHCCIFNDSKLPQDGNHDGMKDHKPVEGHVRRDLDALD